MAPVNRFSVIGLPNYAAQTFTETENSGDFLSAALPLSNLLNEEPSKVGRITTNNPRHTFFSFTMADGLTNFSKTFSGFALVNVNLTRFGKYRVVGRTTNNGSNLPQSQLSPTAIASSTNITGAVTDVDELTWAADAAWITPTNKTLPWDARFSFGTPANTPRTGANYQAFVLWVRRQGGSTVQLPLIKVELWENGVLKADLGTRVITDTTGQALVFHWNAASLATASGADVEVKVRVPFNDTVSYAELGALQWYSEYSSGAAVGFAYDSGWLSSPFSGANDIDLVGPQPTKSLFYIPDVPWTGVIQWIWFISDDQADQDEAGVFSATTALSPASAIGLPQGYVQAGVMCAGYTFVAERGQRLDAPYDVGVLTQERGGTTEGGQTFAADAFRRRQATVNLYLNRDEAVDLMDRLDWRRGRSSPVFVVIEPAVESGLQLFHAFYATVTDAGRLSPLPQKYEVGEEMVFQKTYSFDERL